MGAFFEREVLAKENGAGEYKIDGKGRFAGFINIPERGLTILVSIDEKEVLAPLSALIKTLVPIALVILALVRDTP